MSGSRDLGELCSRTDRQADNPIFYKFETYLDRLFVPGKIVRAVHENVNIYIYIYTILIRSIISGDIGLIMKCNAG